MSSHGAFPDFPVSKAITHLRILNEQCSLRKERVKTCLCLCLGRVLWDAAAGPWVLRRGTPEADLQGPQPVSGPVQPL